MTFVSPMLAGKAIQIDEISLYAAYRMEPKYDGMRAVVVVSDAGVEIYSRTGKSQAGKLPVLESVLRQLPYGTYDGELGVISHYVEVSGESVPFVDFNRTMRIMGSGKEKAALRETESSVSFLAFDIVTDSPQTLRGSELLGVLVKNPLVIPPISWAVDDGQIYSTILEHGGEGVILKHSEARYIPGKRSRQWLKIKSEQTFDVVVTGATKGAGKYEGMVGALEFSAYSPEGELVSVGRCSGMTDELRQEFTVNPPVGKVIEIKSNDLVGSGEYKTPRHPQFVCVRLDKNPEDCLLTQFKE